MIGKVPPPKLATSLVKRAPAALASRISGLVGQLIKLPVADPQRGGDVLRLRAVQDQALHGTVERRPGHVGLVLGMDQPLLGLAGLGQPLLIHLAHSSEVLITLIGNQHLRDRGGSHHGTVGRKRLLLQLDHLRRAVRHEGPPRAGEQLAEDTHRIELLREPGAAWLLTAYRGAP